MRVLVDYELERFGVFSQPLNNYWAPARHPYGPSRSRYPRTRLRLHAGTRRDDPPLPKIVTNRGRRAIGELGAWQTQGFGTGARARSRRNVGARGDSPGRNAGALWIAISDWRRNRRPALRAKRAVA